MEADVAVVSESSKKANPEDNNPDDGTGVCNLDTISQKSTMNLGLLDHLPCTTEPDWSKGHNYDDMKEHIETGV